MDGSYFNFCQGRWSTSGHATVVPSTSSTSIVASFASWSGFCKTQCFAAMLGECASIRVMSARSLSSVFDMVISFAWYHFRMRFTVGFYSHSKKKLLTERLQRMVHVDRPHPFDRGTEECLTVLSPGKLGILEHGPDGARGKPLGQFTVHVARLVVLAEHVLFFSLHLRTKVSKLQYAPLATTPTETVTVYHPDDGGVGEALYVPRECVESTILLSADEGHHGVVNTCRTRGVRLTTASHAGTHT